jgi:hypothetical protein
MEERNAIHAGYPQQTACFLITGLEPLGVESWPAGRWRYRNFYNMCWNVKMNVYN